MPDFPWYHVSTLGRCMSVKPRSIKGQLIGKPRNLILRPQFNKAIGYLNYRFYNEEGWVAIYAHRAVIMSHVGPIKRALVIDHLNECKTDNRLTNIIVTSYSHNLWKSGRHENYTAKIVKTAINLRKQGLTYAQIGEAVEVSATTVWRWCRGIQGYLRDME